MRQQRKRLSDQAQCQASRNLAMQARHCYRALNAQRILSYAPFAGEISPHNMPLSSAANIYLPRITNYSQNRMCFYQAGKSQTNRFGIREPVPTNKILPANAFDLILLPLVAFDRNGARLGMGAGFYDRALASLTHQVGTRPYLLGISHHFQEVKGLTKAAWDVPLDAILTDREFIKVM